jgi:hypothetical protein
MKSLFKWLWRIDPLIALEIKILKLAIYLILRIDPKFDYKSIKLVKVEYNF